MLKETENSINEVISSNIRDISSPLDRFLLEMKEIIEEWPGKLSELSFYSKVDPKTIRTLRDLKNKRFPNADTILKICSTVSKIKTVKGIAEYYGSEVANFLRDSFPIYFSDDCKIQTKIDFEVSEVITDFYSYVIINLCNDNNGYSRVKLEGTLARIAMIESPAYRKDEHCKELQKAFIPEVKYRVDILLKSGQLLLLENGLLKTKVVGIQIPYEIAKKYLPKMMIFIEPSEWANSSFFIRGFAGSGNKNDVELAIREIYNGFIRANKIMENSKGNEISIQLMAMAESLQFSELPTKEELR